MLDSFRFSSPNFLWWWDTNCFNRCKKKLLFRSFPGHVILQMLTKLTLTMRNEACQNKIHTSRVKSAILIVSAFILFSYFSIFWSVVWQKSLWSCTILSISVSWSQMTEKKHRQQNPLTCLSGDETDSVKI